MNTLTDDQKRAKIADACGINGFAGKLGVEYEFKRNGKWIVVDPLTDERAAAQMRAALTEEERKEFVYCLEEILWPDGNAENNRNAYNEFDYINATPTQQAEAFAKTRSLW